MTFYVNEMTIYPTHCDLQLELRRTCARGHDGSVVDEEHTVFLARPLALWLYEQLQEILQEPVPPLTEGDPDAL